MNTSPLNNRSAFTWRSVTDRPGAKKMLETTRTARLLTTDAMPATPQVIHNKMTASVLRAIESGAKMPVLAEEEIPEQEKNLDPVVLAERLLALAAEIEHTLMVEYLYAYFSLDQNSQFGSNQADTVLTIAIEEMGHLMTVQNLRKAIREEPHFDLQTVPSLGAGDPDYPFPLRLVPLTKEALATFVTAEAPVPLPDNLPPDDTKAANDAEALANTAILSGVKHVGMLYARLIWLFQESDNPGSNGGFNADMSSMFGSKHLPPDFMFQTDGQEPSDKWPAPFTRPGFFVSNISNRQDALTALQKIAVQGEGWDIDEGTDPSHFERFLTLWKNYPVDTSDLLLSTAENPRLPSDPDWPTANAHEIPTAQQPAVIFFRTRYELLVLSLTLLLVTSNQPLRVQLRSHALSGMRGPISRLAATLATAKSGAPFRLLGMLPFDEATLKHELQLRIIRSKTESQQVPGNWAQVLAKDDQLAALF